MPYATVSPSLLLQNGESLINGKEQMAHSSINVTVDIYGHLVPGGNRQAVDKTRGRLTTNGKETAYNKTANKKCKQL
jgi:integrase